MNTDDCIGKGLLRKASVGSDEVKHQIEIAEAYIGKAGKIAESKVFDIAFLTVYISMFHSARALLYAKGYKERSHFCLFEFVHEEFKNSHEILRLARIAQNYREVRHMIQYEGALCSEDSVKEAINDARKFLKEVKKLLQG